MAMPYGKAAVADEMQFVKGMVAGGDGGEVQARPWGVDERDGFIAWLRSEFAAANAIIDLMSDHLGGVGEAGEYGYVISAIQRRRCNWSPVLHMQPYFPIGEVSFALQQVLHRRKQQQRRYHDHPRRFSDKGFRKTGYKQQAHNGGNSRDLRAYEDEGEDKVKTFDEDSSIPTVEKRGANSAPDDAEVDIAKKVGAEAGGIEAKQEVGEIPQDCEEAGENAEFNNALADSEEGEVQSSSPFPKQFKVHEVVDGKLVNVVEGLKLYENLFDSSEISKLFFLANELRAAGRRGEFPGSTFFVSKRPMRGHGRETLQFCPSVTDWSSDGNTTGVYVKEHTLDKIPGLFQDVINRLVQLQIMSVKPDSCIINFYHEGDHSHPHMFPSWYGRPVCVFSLNECDMVFGRVFGIDYPGNFKSALKLSLAAGSIIVVQGKSADLSKHAISSLRKQRVLVTFTKYCAKISASTDDNHLPLAHQMAGASPLPWCPGLSCCSSCRHYLPCPQHVGAIPTCVVLSASQTHAHLSPSNSVQPLFTAAPVTSVASAMSFPAPVPLPPSVTWQPVPPRPHPLVHGTGVFLPPGSGQLKSAQFSVGDANSTLEISGQSESTSWSGTTENGASSSVASSEDAPEGRGQNPDCSGHIFTKEPVDSRVRYEES